MFFFVDFGMKGFDMLAGRKKQQGLGAGGDSDRTKKRKSRFHQRFSDFPGRFHARSNKLPPSFLVPQIGYWLAGRCSVSRRGLPNKSHPPAQQPATAPPREAYLEGSTYFPAASCLCFVPRDRLFVRKRGEVDDGVHHQTADTHGAESSPYIIPTNSKDFPVCLAMVILSSLPSTPITGEGA